MSRIRFSPNLFIEAEELNKFQQFIFDNGFERILLQNTQVFGILNNTRKGGQFTNGLVELGTNTGTIKHEELYAFDSNGRTIYKPATDLINLPNDNTWRWVKVSFVDSPVEKGAYSIDTAGNLTGNGTIDLTAILRGQPNIASRVAFPNALLNTGAYDVQEVIDNTTAILSGSFVAETGLTLKVVGSFTPDAEPTSADKDIFRYDSCLMTLVTETVLDTPPTLIADQEFVLARVKRNGATVVIQDKRLLNIWKTRAEFVITDITDTANPLVGVEAVKYNDAFSTRAENLLYLSWTFRSNNWTIDTNTNKITLNAGLGGAYKTTSDFNNGDFDGWRLYAKDGTYSVIQSSYKSGSQVNLILASLEESKFVDTTAWVTVAPNAEEVQLFFSGDLTNTNKLTQKTLTFPINLPFVVVPLLVYASPTCSYGFNYRYKTLDTFGTLRAMPSDPTNGYLNESSFDDNGNQIATVRTTYTSSLTTSFIVLTQAGNAYQNIIGSLTTGQAIGVEYVAVNTLVNPVTRFVVGTRKEHIVITNDSGIEPGDSDFGTPYSLTADAFLDLRTDLPSTLKNGNSFLIQIRGSYILNGHQFNIVQNYVNSGSTGTNLYTLTQSDLNQAALDNLIFLAKFNGTNWFLHKFISIVGTVVASSRTISTTAPLTGGGDLSADRILAINNAAADGATKGAAAFASNDFDSSAGVISLDYTNGPARASRTITAGSGLSGGGDLSADRTLSLATIAWTTITLVNGWTATSTNVQYKVANGICFLRGTIDASAATNDKFGVGPTATRASGMIVAAQGGAVFAQFGNATNGDITIGGHGIQVFDLDGICYAVD